MQKIQVNAFRGDEKVSFFLQPYDNPVAQRWVKELVRLEATGVSVLEKQRIYGLNETWTEEQIVSDIRICVEKIASEVDALKPYDLGSFDQDKLNRLHAEYGKLMGSASAFQRASRDYSPEVVEAIAQLNVLVHRHESFVRHQKNPAYGRIVVTFEAKNKQPFVDEDYELFTPDYKAGDVVLNYCQVGKSILDYVADQDPHIPMEYVGPQKVWCGDFMLVLRDGPASFPHYQEILSSFWKDHRGLMASHGYFEGDPKLGIGSLPVAHITEEAKTFRERIYGITSIESVQVI